jgi:hypothetical protein
MFLVVTCLALLFAVFGAIGLSASFALLLVLALVGLHVIGNVLGTKLQNETPFAAAEDENTISASPPADYAARIACPHSISGLYQQTRLGWIIHVTTAIGALAGALLGTSFLVNFANTSIRGIIVGAVSSGVLGAFMGFMYGSFLKIWLSAWWQASSESDKFDRRKPSRATFLPRLRSDVSASLVADIDAG